MGSKDKKKSLDISLQLDPCKQESLAAAAAIAAAAATAATGSAADCWRKWVDAKTLWSRRSKKGGKNNNSKNRLGKMHFLGAEFEQQQSSSYIFFFFDASGNA